MLYDRSDPRQRDVWKQKMRPTSRGSARGLMEPRTYAAGVQLLMEHGYARTTDQADDKTLVPNWSRHVKPPLDTDVDHVIELQVLGPTWRLIPWANDMGNFEILDAAANRSSGTTLDDNIARERRELAEYYKDPLWEQRDLVFERVEVGDSGVEASVRWSDDDVMKGHHLVSLRELLKRR